jgi:hypothetical protein
MTPTKNNERFSSHRINEMKMLHQHQNTTLYTRQGYDYLFTVVNAFFERVEGTLLNKSPFSIQLIFRCSSVYIIYS